VPYTNNSQSQGTEEMSTAALLAAGVIKKQTKKKTKGERCPTSEATCRRCNRKGHFGTNCFSRTTAPLAEVDPDLPETGFLDAVSNTAASCWMVTLTMGDRPPGEI